MESDPKSTRRASAGNGCRFAAGPLCGGRVPGGCQRVRFRTRCWEGSDKPFLPRVEVPVTVTPGTTAAAVPNVSMVKGGTILGRVLDPQGKPLSFAIVQALRSHAGARNAEFTTIVSRQTDDRGEYRMFWVPPGEYLIRVSLGERGPGIQQVSPTTGEIARMVSTL